ncbi:MAG: LysM peptidoglycan-binding domain-containing protein [Planctomycetaceae bacterium]|jgi:phage tail protein X|nr:LysM peptidoglycan-binding domain-containing protein [Planctomycetaceae bacterium]
MSNKNHSNSASDLEISATLPDNNTPEIKPLPFPSRNKTESIAASSSIGNNNNDNNNSGDDNYDDNEGLAALINNISVTNNAGASNQDETKLHTNYMKDLINIVTKICSPIYSCSKSILAVRTKLSVVGKLFLQLIKIIPSYFTLKIDDNLNNTTEIDNANYVTDRINNQDKKQSQIDIQSAPENLSGSKINKTINTKSNIVTENRTDTPITSYSTDLYGDDNDIYEGSSWQNVLIKSAILAVALLLLIAGYIGIRSIINPKIDSNIAAVNPDDQTNNNTDNSTPLTQKENINNTNNNSSRDVAPSIVSSDYLPRNDNKNTSVNNNLTQITPEPKNENINTITPQPHEQTLTQNKTPNNNFSVNPPPTNNSLDNTLSSPNPEPVFTTSSAPVTVPPPIDANLDHIFGSSSPENPATPPIPQTNNDFLFDNNTPGTFSTNTSEPSNTTNTANIHDKNNITSPSDNPPLDNSQSNSNNIVLAGGNVDIVEKKKEITEKKAEEKNVEKSIGKPDTKSDIKSSENFSIKPNQEMVQLNANNSTPISVTNNQLEPTNQPPLDSNSTDKAKLPPISAGNKSDKKEIKSSPMETLLVTESKPTVLTDTDSTLRVPPPDYNLNPNQNKTPVTEISAADKSKQPISVTQNQNTSSIVADNKAQPHFTETTPPIPTKSDVTLPDIVSMRPLQTVVSNESTPSIPPTEAVVPVEKFSPVAADSNIEPVVRIPLESVAPPQPTNTKTISVAQKDIAKIPATDSNNSTNNQPVNTAISPTLKFDNNITNNRNKNSDKTNDNSDGAKLFNETNNPAPLAAINSPTHVTPIPVPVPIDPDDPQSNTLSTLLPSNTPDSDNVTKTLQNALETLHEEAPAVLAESNPGYRHLPLTRDPAAVQLQNSGKVLPTGTVAPNYHSQLDREITRSPANAELYTVKAGDTYMSICDNYYGTGLLYRALAVHNRNRGAAWIPVEGTQIEIPTADYLRANYGNILAQNSRYNSRNNNTTTSQTKTSQPNSPTTTQPIKTQSSGTKYIVKQGDSVFKIAQEQLRDTTRWSEIIRFNSDKLKSARDLKPGMEINLPTATASSYISTAH